jgi:competence protein ComEA
MNKTFAAALALALVFGASVTFAADLNKDDAATIAKDGMGIGTVKAEMIVAERTKNGPFKSWEDLKMRIKGFGPATIEKNKSTLTFGPAAAAPTAAPAPAATPAATPAAVAPAAAPAAVPAQ